MSKELEALESLFNDYKIMCEDTNSNEHIYEECNLTSPYNTIKKALKDYERFVENVKATLEELRDTSENIKANVASVSLRMRFYANALDDVISLIEDDIADLEEGK